VIGQCPLTASAGIGAAIREGEYWGEEMPKSAFLLYSQAKREEVKGKHPGVDGVGVTKILGEEWKKLSAAEKQEWKAKAAANESGGVEEEEFGEGEEGEEGVGGEVGE
jgi:hypothetical protein